MTTSNLNLTAKEVERPTFHIVDCYKFLALCGANVALHRWTFPYVMRGRMEIVGPLTVCAECQRQADGA